MDLKKRVYPEGVGPQCAVCFRPITGGEAYVGYRSMDSWVSEHVGCSRHGTVEVPQGAFEVLASRLPDLEKKVATMNRKALRFGLPQVTLTVPGIRWTEDIYTDQEDAFLTPVAVRCEMEAAFIEGETVKLAGWEFAGTLEHAGEAGNIVRMVPGIEAPEAFRGVAPFCDHCKVARARHDTYLVRHTETGEWKQVGSGCLKDFLGGLDPKAAARAAEHLAQMRALGESYGYDGRAEGINLDLFMAYVVEQVKRDGWRSRTVARDQGGSATADEALAMLRDTAKIKGQVELAQVNASRKSPLWLPSEGSKATAVEALEWTLEYLESKEETSDYEHNLYVVLKSGAIDSRRAGIAASAYSFRLREGEKAERRAREAEAGRASEHVGTVGKRQEFTVTMGKALTFEGDYGVRICAKMIEGGQNELVWWTSPDAFIRYSEEARDYLGLMAEGGTYRIKATVKGHETYRGNKQTALSRVAVLEEIREGVAA